MRHALSAMKLRSAFKLPLLVVGLFFCTSMRADAGAPSAGGDVQAASEPGSAVPTPCGSDCGVSGAGGAGESEAPYDFDSPTSNIVTDKILPVVIPIMFETNGGLFGTGDATLIFRWALMVSVAWFDAVAPYHPTAVGVFSDLGRRPASESETNGDLSIAIAYSSQKIFAWCASKAQAVSLRLYGL